MATVLVTYDVKSDARRRKIAKTLERAGRRLQQSVFVLQGDEATPARTEAALHAHLTGDAKGLDVRILPLCAACQSKTLLFGQAREKDRRARAPYKIL